MWYENKGNLEVRDNKLFFAGMPASKLAKEYGTPLYVYNADRIRENFLSLKNAFMSEKLVSRIYYAMKANSHIEVLKLLLEEGAWIDAVSPMEACRALEAGYPKEKIMFTGTSPSNQDLENLLELNVTINIDSFSMLRRLKEMSPDSLRVSVRWNPGAGAGHHAKTITAGKYVKFGIPEHRIYEAFEQVRDYGYELIGLHQHIGSGWLGDDVTTFLSTVDSTLEIALKAQKICGKGLEFVDFGGGPGIPYKQDEEPFPVKEYAKGIAERVKKAAYKGAIAVEPGRYIVGDAGVFLVQVNTVEEKNVTVVGVNSGFNALVRPAMYGSYHEAVLCDKVDSKAGEKKECMIAGNLCESGDVFNQDKKELRSIPLPKEGDILALLCAGAYGYSMASTYNSRPRPREAMIEDGKARLITEADSLEEMTGLEK